MEVRRSIIEREFYIHLRMLLQITSQSWYQHLATECDRCYQPDCTTWCLLEFRGACLGKLDFGQYFFAALIEELAYLSEVLSTGRPVEQARP